MNKNVLLLVLLGFGSMIASNGNYKHFRNEILGTLSGQEVSDQFFESVNVATGKYLATGTLSLDFLDAGQLSERDAVLYDQGADWINDRTQELPILWVFINHATHFFPRFMERCHSINELKHDKEFRELIEWVVKNILKVVENPNDELRKKQVIMIEI